MYMDPAAASLVLERALLSNSTVTLMPMETCLENGLTLVIHLSNLSHAPPYNYADFPQVYKLH